MSGAISDKRMPNKLNREIYRTVARPALMYGAECWTVRKKEEDLMRRTEIRMLRWIVRVSRKDKVGNEKIKRRCEVEDILEKVKEAKLRWFGRVSGRDNGGAVKDIFGMTEVGGSRSGDRNENGWTM